MNYFARKGKKVLFVIFSILLSFQMTYEYQILFSQSHFFPVLNLCPVKTLRLKTLGLTILFFLNSRWQYLFTCSKNLNHSNDYRLSVYIFLSPCRMKSVYLNGKTEYRNSLHASIIFKHFGWGGAEVYE